MRVDDITPRELHERLGRPGAPRLLDVRQVWETRICGLPGALHIPLEELEARLEELDPEAEIVVYCHQGFRSAAVVHWLRSLGFARARNLVGGLAAWARTVDPAMRRY